jgi:hypothetical protein
MSAILKGPAVTSANIASAALCMLVVDPGHL